MLAEGTEMELLQNKLKRSSQKVPALLGLTQIFPGTPQDYMCIFYFI